MPGSYDPFLRRIKRFYLLHLLTIIGFVLLMGAWERTGAPPKALGFVFVTTTIGGYALLGAARRTVNVSEYYVAGRSVPALFGGMAVAADWVSAATFLGLGGALFYDGYQGLAFVLGWGGGFVLLALLFAPYLRRFGQFTIPDFLAARFGGKLTRALCVVPVVIASFVYLTAQVYAVGMISGRFVGLSLEVGILVGLAGILVCSFMGGMRAVMWTQAAQFMVLVVAYLLPIAIISVQLTGNPIPALSYGAMLDRLSQAEMRLLVDPAEHEVRNQFARQAQQFEVRMHALPASLEDERERLRKKLDAMRASDTPARELFTTERKLSSLPATAAEAAAQWETERAVAMQRSAMPAPLADPFPDAPDTAPGTARLNFFALVLCLMVGTASLPHLLMRSYMTPSVREARQTVFWSLCFLCLIYTAAPAYAVFAKWLLVNDVVGLPMNKLPAWAASWGRTGLVRLEDINGDNILQFAEISINPDVVVLLTPELAGMPFVISALVGAGGLAAALSTADGLLLTIANALSHDVYFKILDPKASTQGRLIASKALVLVVALVAAYAATFRPASILFVVALAFSLAAGAIFPAMVCGIFWSRANRWGAVAAMAAGFTVVTAYMVRTLPALGGSMEQAILGIRPEASGILGVLAGFIAIVAVSLSTKPDPEHVRSMVESVRYPPNRAD